MCIKGTKFCAMCAKRLLMVQDIIAGKLVVLPWFWITVHAHFGCPQG